MEVERYEHGVPSWVDLGTSDIGNAPSTANTTVVYYQGPGNKNAAVCMKMHFFKIATVKIEGNTLQVAVFAGQEADDQWARRAQFVIESGGQIKVFLPFRPEASE